MGLDGVFGGGLGWFVVLGGVFGFVVRFVRGFVFFIVLGSFWGGFGCCL